MGCINDDSKSSHQLLLSPCPSAVRVISASECQCKALTRKDEILEADVTRHEAIADGRNALAKANSDSVPNPNIAGRV